MSSGFFFSSRRRHTRCGRDWSSDVCSSDLFTELVGELEHILHLSSHLEGWALDEISDADIFPSLDKAIITALLNSLLTRAENFDHYEETILARSEERRVGKECRCRWSPYQ